MRSRKLLALLFCLITFPALAGYMTLLGAGLGAIQPVAQSNFIQSSYSANLADLNAVATFSRAGNAMQFDSSGYLTYGPNQQFTQSATFTDASWSKLNCTVSGNTVTATSTSVGLVYKAFTPTANVNYILAFEVSAGTAPYIVIDAPDGASDRYAWFRTSDMTVGTVNGALTASVTSLGAGRYRVAVRFNGGAGSATNYAISGASANGVNTQVVGHTYNVYNSSLAAVTYETTPRTQDQVITTSAAYYGPRFDYTYNGSSWVPAGLLVEGAATNLLLNSKADGTNLSTQSVATTAQAYTLSFYGTGTVTLSGTSTAGPAVGAASPARTTLMFTPTAGSLTLTVTGTVQYAQLETGSTASSFIPTGASTVTRAAETVQLTGTALSTLQGASGTAIVQTTDYPGGSATGILIGGDNNTAYPLAYSSNQGRTYNGFTGMSTANPATLTSPARVGVAWSAAGRSLSLNGGAVATDAGGFSGVTTAWLGVANGGAQYWLNGHIASFALYNSRLPDATLQAKSVVGAAY